MLWDKEIIDKKVAPGKHEFVFNYLGDSQIVSVRGSCGCTTTKLTNNSIKGVVNLKDQGKSYLKRITITVTLKDNTVHKLKLNLNVQDKSN